MVALASNPGGSNGKIPGYQLLGELGKGAMAKVFKARQNSLDRIVAIKVLPKKLGESGEYFPRFMAAARAACRVYHNNIVQTIDAGQTPDGFNYLVMEYVEGITLFGMMAPPPRGDSKTFSEAEALDTSIPIADALACVHEHGLIHGDIKPKNILLTVSDIPKLTDLGLAQRTTYKEAAESETGKAFGNPYYISPEQIRGDANIGARTDIYSFGATMYHLFTGRPAFEGRTAGQVMLHHLRNPVVSANRINRALTPRTARIIDTAMAKRPEDRYQSMAKMLEDLKACRDQL